MDEPSQPDRRESAGQLARVEAKLDEVVEALNGNEKRDIRGVRPRLAATEQGLAELVQAVKQFKDLPEDAKKNRDAIEAFQTERRVIKAWLIGVAAGATLAGTTSLATLVLQLLRLGAGAP